MGTCACKGAASAKKQVTSVKQIVKRTTTPSSVGTRPQRKVAPKRVIIRRPM